MKGIKKWKECGKQRGLRIKIHLSCVMSMCQLPLRVTFMYCKCNKTLKIKTRKILFYIFAKRVWDYNKSSVGVYDMWVQVCYTHIQMIGVISIHTKDLLAKQSFQLCKTVFYHLSKKDSEEDCEGQYLYLQKVTFCLYDKMKKNRAHFSSTRIKLE